ncbi:type II toxin-antitoxin system RelE family toxin [Rhodobium gokarnense]|uniref:mRNA interferase RelE/StbE n=1 Tax=Rhodobium gokarnense TaxID=364296 RepID=A0ABT3H7N0_9HYPH|nr:type II toxin-antitoxin system RelE/ParE family toxin [Rhodobium gokarnense]MCW2306395.1 mRNA interferase RelE/StbE [Rhodobium gokarnense]
MELFITRKALKQMKVIPVRDRIFSALEAYATDPSVGDVVKLQGTTSTYRLRVGDWRAVFDIDEAAGTMTVTRVAHRRDIYR